MLGNHMEDLIEYNTLLEMYSSLKAGRKVQVCRWAE